MPGNTQLKSPSANSPGAEAQLVPERVNWTGLEIGYAHQNYIHKRAVRERTTVHGERVGKCDLKSVL